MDHPRDGAWGPHIPWNEDRQSGSGNQNVDNTDDYDWESVWSTYCTLDMDEDAVPQPQEQRRPGQLSSSSSSDSIGSSPLDTLNERESSRMPDGAVAMTAGTFNPRTGFGSRSTAMEDYYQPPSNFRFQSRTFDCWRNEQRQRDRRDPHQSRSSGTVTTSTHRPPYDAAGAGAIAAVKCEDDEIELQIEAIVLSDYACAVCLETLSKTHLLNCGHKFCQICIVKWRRRSSSQVCPVCRDIIKEAEPDLDTDEQIKQLYLSLPERIQTRRTAFEAERELALSQQMQTMDPDPGDEIVDLNPAMAVADLEAQLRETIHTIQHGLTLRLASESVEGAAAPNGNQNPVSGNNCPLHGRIRNNDSINSPRRVSRWTELLRETGPRMLLRAPPVSCGPELSSRSSWIPSASVTLSTQPSFPSRSEPEISASSTLQTATFPAAASTGPPFEPLWPFTTEPSSSTKTSLRSSALAARPFDVSISRAYGLPTGSMSERNPTFNNITNMSSICSSDATVFDDEKQSETLIAARGRARVEQLISSRDELVTTHLGSLFGSCTETQPQSNTFTNQPSSASYNSPAQFQSQNAPPNAPTGTGVYRYFGSTNTRPNLECNSAESTVRESTSQSGYGFEPGMSYPYLPSNGTQDQLQSGTAHGSQQQWCYESAGSAGERFLPLPPDHIYGRTPTGFYRYEPRFLPSDQPLQPNVQVSGSFQPGLGRVVHSRPVRYFGPQSSRYETSGPIPTFQTSTLMPVQAMNQNLSSSPHLPTYAFPEAPLQLNSLQTVGHKSGILDYSGQTRTAEMLSFPPILRAHSNSIPINQASTSALQWDPTSYSRATPQAAGMLRNTGSGSGLLSQATGPSVSNSRVSHSRDSFTGTIQMDRPGVNSNYINYSFSIQENLYGHNIYRTWPNQLQLPTVEVFPLAELPDARLVVMKFMVSN